jgi:tRNA A-37 threonylcarbamoyl transferase component Bud32
MIQKTIPRYITEIPKPIDIFKQELVYTEDDYWFFVRFSNYQSQQGWKIYVPFTPLNASEIIIRLRDLLKKYLLNFKYVKNQSILRKLNSGQYGYSQIGKCIVIYMPCVIDEFIESLIDILSKFKFKCPIVPFANPIGGGLPIYYRYGSYQSEQLLINNQDIKDIRDDLDCAVPLSIKDLLLKFRISETIDNSFQEFLLKYPVFKVISQRGKGGIFRALNLAQQVYQEVIIKTGNRNGEIIDKNNDGFNLIRREKNFLSYLEFYNLRYVTPELIDYIETDMINAIVLKYINGENLLKLKKENKIYIHHLEQAWNLLGILHENGLYWGDAKLDNLMLDENDRIVMIDFETGGLIEQEQILNFKTFEIVDSENIDICTLDKINFLISIIISDFQEKFQDRRINFESILSLKVNSCLEEWAKNRLISIL